MPKSLGLLRKRIVNNKGQILVEYLLLMVIAISCATLLTKRLVGRSDDTPGIIVKQWHAILKSIGNDVPDCTNQKDFKTTNCPP